MTKKGPTKAQLQRRIARLEAELAKYKIGDTVRSEGEHWYELIEYFDAEQIRRIPSPWEEPTFLMGMLSDTFVVEVPQNAEPAKVEKFLGMLASKGLAPALAIRKGVRFVKLASVSEEKERELDDAAEKIASVREGGPDDAGAGSESAGDGLGGARPAATEADRGRGGRDEVVEREAEEGSSDGR